VEPKDRLEFTKDIGRELCNGWNCEELVELGLGVCHRCCYSGEIDEIKDSECTKTVLRGFTRDANDVASAIR